MSAPPLHDQPPPDPYLDAIEQGIEVGFLPLDTAGGLWIAEKRVIVISSHIDDAVQRRDSLSHMLGHARIEGTYTHRRHQDGWISDTQFECIINARVARRAVSFSALKRALRDNCCDAAGVAAQLGVSTDTLDSRLQVLNYAERAVVGDSVNSLVWPSTPAAVIPQCAQSCTHTLGAACAHVGIRAAFSLAVLTWCDVMVLHPTPTFILGSHF